MVSLAAVERYTRQFYDWELRGRGWQSFPYLVPLEPHFIPFPGFRGHERGTKDDARKPTLLSSLWDRLGKRPPSTTTQSHIHPIRDGTPKRLDGRQGVTEFDVLLPAEANVHSATGEAWLRSIALAKHPISFELIGRRSRVRTRVAVRPDDSSLVLSQLRAFLPEALIRESSAHLIDEWEESGEHCVALEFGLGREFMLPLRVPKGSDPLIPLIGALGMAREGELAVLQILFQEASSPWADSIVRSVVAPDGEAFFLDAPQFTDLACEKASASLCAAVIRLAIRSEDEERSWEIMRAIASAFGQYARPDGNAFVPLASDSLDTLVDDVLSRESHRSGMLLSFPELDSLVRFPDQSIKSPLLARKSAGGTLPGSVLGGTGPLLGHAFSDDSDVPVRLPPGRRTEHAHIIGASGTGKSTLLKSLILEDINGGAGVAVIDPHGDLIEDLLGRVPEERSADVVLIDPSDPDTVVGWNVLKAHSEIEKNLLSSDLVAVFRRLSTSWGDQMSTVLGNAISAILESDRGGTLLDLRRFLSDDVFRATYLPTVRDPYIVAFWRTEYPHLVGKRPQVPILTRLDSFLRSRLIRDVVAEGERPLDFRSLIDGQRILLVKLSQGLIGRENAALLGSLLVSSLHQAGLSRQESSVSGRQPFYAYIDEFQEVAVPSMAGLFSGLRKFGLGLIVAHQDLQQLHSASPDVERAVLANAYTRIVFRVSDHDAKVFDGSLGEFTAADLTNLKRGEAIGRVGERDASFRFRTQELDSVPEAEAEQRRVRIRGLSASRWGRPRQGESPRSEAVTPPPAVIRSPIVPIPMLDSNRQEAASPKAEPGRGGQLHKYLQGLIREWAKTAGFKAEIEQNLPNGGRIDVGLSRGELTIAFEIAGVTTITRELANIQKCLEAGFTHVLSVSLDRRFLKDLERAAIEQVSQADWKRVVFCSPEEVLSFLESKAESGTTARIAGYQVKVRHRPDGIVDPTIRRQAIAEVMLKSVKKLREDR